MPTPGSGKLPTNSLALRSKPQGFRYNQFGWNLNGPVIIPHLFNPTRNKLFFLAGQEYVKYNHDDTAFQQVPTALMRTGNFSELLSPTNTFYGCTSSTNCTNNQIYSPTTGLALCE